MIGLRGERAVERIFAVGGVFWCGMECCVRGGGRGGRPSHVGVPSLFKLCSLHPGSLCSLPLSHTHNKNKHTNKPPNPQRQATHVLHLLCRLTP